MINEIQIDNKIYLTIPEDWKDTYHTLLYVLSIVGNDIVNDCNLCCKDNVSIYNYWNLFQSAIASKTLGNESRATFIYNYILKELNSYIKTYNITIPDVTSNYPKIIYSVDDDGIQTITISTLVNGEIVTKVIKFPDAVENYYYGALNVSDPTLVDLTKLTHTTETIAGKTLTITTTSVNNVVWFISPFKLSFMQGGIPVSLNEFTISGMHYYSTDPLIADDNVFIISHNNN